jgi:two-component system copper resistance phosphate regulon response regulator CusR
MLEEPMRVLLLDSDPTTVSLQKGLRDQDFDAHWCVDAGDALEAHAVLPFDAMICETRQGNLDGLAFVRQLRVGGDPTPILFLSHHEALMDRVEALETGGDDYLVKPAALLEIVARIRAILRRSILQRALPDRVSMGDLEWDPSKRLVTRGGQKVDLTPKEYALAALLLAHQGRIVDRETIARVVWGANGVSDANSVDVQVRRLRKKLDEPFEQKLIHTVRGEGVMLGLR